MLRTVLAVALAAALVTTATPALESARTTRSERLVAGELDRIETTARALVREESSAPLGAPGPRRTLTVSLPGESPTTAPVAHVALGGLPEENATADTTERDVFASQVSGARRRVRRVEFDLRAAVPTDADSGANPGTDFGWRIESDATPVVLRGGETYRLALRLVRLDGRPTVLLAVRGFTTEDGTTPAHARLAGATPRPRGRDLRVRTDLRIGGADTRRRKLSRRRRPRRAS